MMPHQTSALQQAMTAAVQHHRAGRLADADALYRQVLAIEPDHFDALHLLGVIALQVGKAEQAVVLIRKALTRNPSSAEAQNHLGEACRSLRRFDEAGAAFRKALALKPDYAEAHANLGSVHRAEGKLDQAGECYRQALAIRADFFEAHNNLGNVLRAQHRLDEAAESYRQALALKPDAAETHGNLGTVFQARGDLPEAIASYQRAVALRPDLAEAHNNLGSAYQIQGRLDRARACFQKALQLDPQDVGAQHDLGKVYYRLGDHDAAIACYRQVLALQPDHAEAHSNLGNVFHAEGEFAPALACHRKALELKPGFVEARWACAMAEMGMAYEEEGNPAGSRSTSLRILADLDGWFDAARIKDGHKAVGSQQPFFLAYREEDHRDVLAKYGSLCARLMHYWQNGERLMPATHARGETIRIGVVSAHIFDHSVWNALVKGWFRELDRGRFSWHVFHTGTGVDQETAYARSRATHFEQGGREVRDWVEAILQQQLDVIIYPEIGMDPMTVKLASLRLAPVQVAAWGHPVTTGLPTIDHYLSAEGLEPPGAAGHYVERLETGPHLGCCYHANPVTPVPPDLAALGIAADVPVLLCPGTPFKYAPRHDRVFVDIARRLARCQLVFFDNPRGNLSARLRQRLDRVFADAGLEFQAYGVFIPWQERAAFHGLMRRADVYLDTIGFSGFNTAMQAVECGLPVVTREGRFMRGRLASGILKRIGLPELVAASDDQYVARVVELAGDAGYRERIRRRIESSREILFDDLAPIRALEAFLVRVTRPDVG